jgi:thiamine transport system substrate-binding protein
MHRILARALSLVAAACLPVACGSGPATAPDPGPFADQAITLVTHDSFRVSQGILEAFTAETGVTVTVENAGDTGQMVATSILTADNPIGDVMYGVDNTFLQRALDAELFEAYESPALANVPMSLQLDPGHRVTPIDFGDVCANYWIDRFGDDLPVPVTLADLVDPVYRGLLVVENPETSSPGLAFLLATIAEFGDGWEEFWKSLRINDVVVTASWDDAYYGEFVSGGGDRPIVISYASSPPAEVIYADPPVDTAPTGVMTDTCFRQVEFAGILAGTTHRSAAEALVDFLLSDTFQEDIPLNMFVFPASTTATLPRAFVDHVVLPEDPYTLPPAEIGANRNAWTERWTQIVLR